MYMLRYQPPLTIPLRNFDGNDRYPWWSRYPWWTHQCHCQCQCQWKPTLMRHRRRLYPINDTTTSPEGLWRIINGFPGSTHFNMKHRRFVSEKNRGQTSVRYVPWYWGERFSLKRLAPFHCIARFVRTDLLCRMVRTGVNFILWPREDRNGNSVLHVVLLY